jgi:hypothetical protein
VQIDPFVHWSSRLFLSSRHDIGLIRPPRKRTRLAIPRSRCLDERRFCATANAGPSSQRQRSRTPQAPPRGHLFRPTCIGHRADTVRDGQRANSHADTMRPATRLTVAPRRPAPVPMMEPALTCVVERAYPK